MTRTLTLDDIAVDQNLVAGYDAGGTKVDVRVRNKATGEILAQHYASCDFPSLDAVLDQSFLDLGARPSHIALLIAGLPGSNGDVQMTDDKLGWPLFELSKTAQRLGVSVETGNDMKGVAAGLKTLDIEKQQTLKAGTADPNGPRLLIAPGTGVGAVLGDMTGEGGHITWQPMPGLEYRYLRFLRAKSGTLTITVEVAASGGQGFDNLYDFLVVEGRKLHHRFSKSFRPGRTLAREVARYRNQGKGIGPLITAAAIAGNPFCRCLMSLLGSILGQHAYCLAVVILPTGGVFFSGSVMQAPGVADYIIEHTPFLERFVAEGSQHADTLKTLRISVINDPNVAVMGALEIAAQQN